MAEKNAGARKTPEKKGAAPKKKSRGISALYDPPGTVLVRKNKFCPKCGMGVFLAKHKDRVTCGKCRYTEFKR